MSRRWKNIMYNSIVLLIVLFFVLSYIVGKNIDQKEAQKSATSGESFFSNNNSSSGTAEIAPAVGTKQSKNELKNVANDTAPTLETYFSQDDIDRSRNVAMAFARSYTTLNGDDPTQNIKNASREASGALKGVLKNETGSATPANYKESVTDVKTFEPGNPDPKTIIWNVRVDGVIYNNKGKEQGKTTTLYLLKMIKENGQYKVDSVNFAKPDGLG